MWYPRYQIDAFIHPKKNAFNLENLESIELRIGKLSKLILHLIWTMNIERAYLLNIERWVLRKK